MSSETNNSRPELSKVYDPKNVESRWYDVWDKAGYFQPATETSTGKPATFVMVIPPPNVTGSLHMGHALNQTLQDILLRYHKMKSNVSLWVPGTDHGGIATQNVVEKILLKEGKNRHVLGREKFLEVMWKWRQDTGDTILMQSKRLGSALDWTRNRFTMDEVCSRAVRHAFVDLFNKKLLYRGKRLVNWCVRCNTALADIEVEHKETKGSLWHIRYPLVKAHKAAKVTKSKTPTPQELGYIVVATTRPETMLGDTAVAVNPKDKRYKDLVGAHIKLPLMNREIPIVADDAVDKSFGSGAVKVTPSHDATDFEIGERNKLPHVVVIGFDGKMTKEAGSYAGMPRFDARKKIVEDLEAQGLIEKIEDYKLSVSVCYRCEQIIEPLESEQWFLSMAAMAKKALNASKKGHVKIVPESWESPYQLWLRNLRDWCVSRQIWWGHRIPVWYCAKGCPPIVPLEDPKECPKCKSKELTQDSDVLDTWFSSALWPFSVFHWPDQTADLKKFYPGHTLVTGHEILYLWVARMVMFGLEFQGKVPFQKVLIHGIVRDKQGRKMSKSLGNVIDPLELIQEFGADAVRFSLAQSAAPGRDMQISKENFVSSRNFSNKVWNATRFVLMNLGNMGEIPALNPKDPQLELADKWILNRFNEVINETTEAIERYDLDSASRGLYEFFWSDFCDWYVEIAKSRVDRVHYADIPVTEESTQLAKTVLATVLEGCVRMLHPFVPFITEELWEKIPKSSGAPVHVMAASWPTTNAHYAAPAAAKEMGMLQEVVTKLRTIRSEMGIPTTRPIEVIAKTRGEAAVRLLKEQEAILKCLNSRVGKLQMGDKLTRPKASAAAVIPGADLYVPLEGLIDFAKERARLEKELDVLRQDAERLAKKTSNSDFLAHAPKEEVDKAKDRLQESKGRIKHIEESIATLSS